MTTRSAAKRRQRDGLSGYPQQGGQQGGASRAFNDNAPNHIPPFNHDYSFSPKPGKQTEQAEMVDANDITFSIGPAGTGKTYIAIGKAIAALKAGKVDTILLSRPAVEAGKTIGFLPGDQNEKMSPYMRPLYDELDAAFGRGNWQHMLYNTETNPSGCIEVCPVGMMRGRTFKKCFVVLDEAQNLLDEELTMAVTRLGAGSKMVITGDPNQIDLNPKEDSGLKRMVEKLEGVENIAAQYYGREDVMRHPTVQAIVDRLEEKAEQKQPVRKLGIPRQDSPAH